MYHDLLNDRKYQRIRSVEQQPAISHKLSPVKQLPKTMSALVAEAPPGDLDALAAAVTRQGATVRQMKKVSQWKGLYTEEYQLLMTR